MLGQYRRESPWAGMRGIVKIFDIGPTDAEHMTDAPRRARYSTM